MAIYLKNGFEMASSLGFKQQIDIVSRIKGLIVDRVYSDWSDSSKELSDVISTDIGQSYSHLSRTFSCVEGRIISEFYRLHRIERAKQPLEQTTDQIGNIALRLDYGSAGRLITVFRQNTGLSFTAFRTRGKYVPHSLDKL
ncbi:helix-turn-helix domain-containing protein [Neolewinella maritima]|uniref:helix-turn-helix domain-containing protein n=1 Tax=Neolewinella maritima TaxID=1383882 RepID=UPI001EE88844|nr:helix-turn-helix domain-containing protein [Neolewinella maritima]